MGSDRRSDEEARLRARLKELEAQQGSEDGPETTPPTAMRRKVGILLGLGIFFLPFVFAWVLLRRGYSSLARIVGFGWMALLLLALIANRGGGPLTPPVPQGSAEQAPSASTPLAEFQAKEHAMVQAELLCEGDYAVAFLANQGGDAVAGYRAAHEGEAACRETERALGKIRFGKPIPEEVSTRLNSALDACAKAEGLRGYALFLQSKVFNGERRASDIAAAEDADRVFREQRATCDNAYSAAAALGGFPKPGSAAAGTEAAARSADVANPPAGGSDAPQQTEADPAFPNPYPPAGTPADIRALLANEGRENEACRGGSGDDATMAACKRRDAYSAQLEARGWCYGEGASDGAHSFWAKCRGPTGR
jgi:hypothetical protein